MSIETGKLYLVNPHSSQNIGKTARLELRGVTSVIIYGTDEKDTDSITDENDLTLVSEVITDDFFYPLDTLPTYIAFVGTVTLINITGYDLTYIKDLT
jgi:hypothetical protein